MRIEQTRRRLAKLRQEGLVDRITLPRAGRTRVWFATQYGVDVALEWPELREWRPPRLTSDRTAARLRVGHTLTVTETGLTFLQDARRRGDVCQPLDWIPEVYHPLSNGEAVIPDALLYYRPAVVRTGRCCGRSWKSTGPPWDPNAWPRNSPPTPASRADFLTRGRPGRTTKFFRSHTASLARRPDRPSHAPGSQALTREQPGRRLVPEGATRRLQAPRHKPRLLIRLATAPRDLGGVVAQTSARRQPFRDLSHIRERPTRTGLGQRSQAMVNAMPIRTYQPKSPITGLNARVHNVRYGVNKERSTRNSGRRLNNCGAAHVS
ncbi:replication-relaxation family protein [Streptomyces sp. NPDC006476]|uniref:replication-relaxation family protein n=1 Tax=Streptomyces sp. NPDC006476 TaxID=3157175 RepID=UPI0033AA00BD